MIDATDLFGPEPLDPAEEDLWPRCSVCAGPIDNEGLCACQAACLECGRVFSDNGSLLAHQVARHR